MGKIAGRRRGSKRNLRAFLRIRRRWLTEDQPDEVILRAVRSRNVRHAKMLLRRRRLNLRVEHLPGGPLWVVSPRIFYCWVCERNHQLLIALEKLCSSMRLVLGKAAYRPIAANEWWAAGCFDELERRLSGMLERYDPACYLIWGRYLARQNHLDAGMYLLLSGLYDATEAPLVESFKRRCQKMAPAQVVTVLPGAAWRRATRARYPERVLRDLADLPIAPWMRRRPRREAASCPYLIVDPAEIEAGEHSEFPGFKPASPAALA